MRLRENVRNLRRVDDTNHASLAMASLSAVEPYWSRSVLDLIGEGPVGNLLGIVGRDEARPEAVVHGRTWLGESALSNGVVLGPELESDSVALSCGNGLRNEDEASGLVRNGNDMVFRNSGTGKGGSGED